MELVAVKAKTMGAALNQVKKQFGDDAFIESTTEQDGEIVIQVLVGKEEPSKEGEIQKVGVVRKQAVKTTNEIESPITENLTVQEDITEEEDQELPVHKDHQINIIAQTVTTVTAAPPTYRLKSPLAAIKLIYDLCDVHGLDEDFCEQWLASVAHNLAKEPINIASGLEGFLKFEPTLFQKIIPMQAMVLVGPPGAGKTVTLAKIAVNLISAGRAVYVVNLDILKAAAGTQLEAYMKPMNQTVHHGEEALKKAYSMLHNPGNNAVVLIDTPAVNIYDDEDVQMVQDIFKDGMLHPTLVIPADINAHDAGEFATQFAPYSPYYTIATKMDVSHRRGAALMAAFKSGSALTVESHNPKLSEPFHNTQANILVDAMLNAIT